MLRAVPVEGFDVDDDASLHARRVLRVCERSDEDGFLCAVDDARPAPDLEAPALGVVHQEEHDASVGIDVADAEILNVAAKVSEPQAFRIEHLQETGRPAAKLHIGPPGLAHGGLIEPVARLDEFALEL